MVTSFPVYIQVCVCLCDLCADTTTSNIHPEEEEELQRIMQVWEGLEAGLQSEALRRPWSSEKEVITRSDTDEATLQVRMASSGAR